MSKAEVTVAWPETEFLHPGLNPPSAPLPSNSEGVGYLDTAGGQTSSSDKQTFLRLSPDARTTLFYNPPPTLVFFLTAGCREGAECTPGWVASSSHHRRTLSDHFTLVYFAQVYLSSALKASWPLCSHQHSFQVLDLEASSTQASPLQTELPPLISIMGYPGGRDWFYPSENVPHDSWDITESLLALLGFGFYWGVSAAVCAQAKRCKSSVWSHHQSAESCVSNLTFWHAAVHVSSKNATLSSQHEACKSAGGIVVM